MNCVFCGDRPSNKNKEHILPKWLIEITGDPTRQANVCWDWEKQESKVFAFSALVAPACTQCNTSWADREGKTKALLKRVLANQSILVADLILLLDWLDKVRVGYWLLVNRLSKSPWNVSPKFSIDQRVGDRDRVLIACAVTNRQRGLGIYGAITPLFNLQPSCFALIINGVALVSISDTALLGGNAGLPWAKLECCGPNGYEAEVQPATHRPNSPMVDCAAITCFANDGELALFAQCNDALNLLPATGSAPSLPPPTAPLFYERKHSTRRLEQNEALCLIQGRPQTIADINSMVLRAQLSLFTRVPFHPPDESRDLAVKWQQEQIRQMAASNSSK